MAGRGDCAAAGGVCCGPTGRGEETLLKGTAGVGLTSGGDKAGLGKATGDAGGDEAGLGEATVAAQR